MEDKSRFITPLLMLFAGAIASIIMYVKGYELTKMLWVLLIVLIIFYFLGDTARYIYSQIRPRIVPEVDYSEMEKMARKSLDLTGNVVEFTDDTESGEQEYDEAAADDEVLEDSAEESYDEG